MREPLVFLEKVFHYYGDVARPRIPNLRICSIAYPGGIKHVLQEKTIAITASHSTTRYSRVCSVTPSSPAGSLWLRQRRLMQPMFHRQKVAGLGALMADSTLQTLDRWR